MEEGRRAILQESNRMLSKLQLLSVFFADEVIFATFLRTQVIHQLFEKNEELDINKLELFHLQFTASLIDLLRKIKKSNEQKVLLMMEEVRINQEMIEKVRESGFSEKAYHLEMQRQSLKVKRSLQQLFRVLSEDSTEYPFSKNINSFSSRFASGHYYTIDAALLALLTTYDVSEIYTNAHAIIQKKLMGLLCKHEFEVVFFCGLASGSAVMEVYKIKDTNILFVFYPARNLFLLCDTVEVDHIMKTATIEKTNNIVQDLLNKNDRLNSSISVARIAIPLEIKQLISDHYKKISDIDFLQSMRDFDTQMNILKTMISTKII
ncbi:MAG: hypothetical protein EOP56_13480 [Sphingobacteriales bacterium]|nr:MAG: hypothetical protein EOP56_13480 [Sphingobacteriales bacterium]